MKTAKINHLHSNAQELEGKSAGHKKEPKPLPPGVPEEPVFVRIRGRIIKLTEKAIRGYLNEYGLDESIPFEFTECIDHMRSELEVAMQSTPIPVSRRTAAVRLHSHSLIFTMIGSSVMGVRISLKYSSREKSAENAV
tara:strand:+ start:79 stop:492 length:414 start_codon:yes stop_codon:yes gene_type:complete